MAIWTKDEFKTESHKYWSKRNGTIKRIDDALDEYHAAKDGADKGRAKLQALDTVLLDFEREKRQKYSNSVFTQSKKRKDAVAQLRMQVEPVLWQWDYEDGADSRSDLQSFLKKAYRGKQDVTDMTKMFQALKIEIKQGTDGTNDLKRKLHKGLEDFFGDKGKPHWKGPFDKDLVPWKNGYFTSAGVPADNIRVATLDMGSLMNEGKAQYLRFGSRDDESWMNEFEKTAMFGKTKVGTDATVGPMQSRNQVAEYLTPELRKLMEKYLRALLQKDLVAQSALIDRGLSSEDGYRAVVHIDYYATRNTNQVGLHKDTNGNNVFAVLHYINDEPMLGPEYIDDPAPIKSRKDGYYPKQVWAKLSALPHGDEYYRQGAPWAKVGESREESEDDAVVTSKYTWPSPMLDALQAARVPLKNLTDYEMSYETLPKDGLVCFVDELIFHATPITGHRTDSPADDAVRYLSAGAQVVSLIDGHNSKNPQYVNLFGERQHATRVKRRLSAHYTKGVHEESGIGIPGSTSGGVRKFFRLWICIVPDHWYVPLPEYEDLEEAEDL